MSVLDSAALAADTSGDLLRSRYLAQAVLSLTRSRSHFESLLNLLDLVDVDWFPTAGQQALYLALIDLAPSCHEDGVITVTTLAAAAEKRAGKTGWARGQINNLLHLPVEASWEVWRDELVPIWRRMRIRNEALTRVAALENAIFASCDEAHWAAAARELHGIQELIEEVGTPTAEIHPLLQAHQRALGPVLEDQFVSTGIAAFDSYLDGGFIAPGTAQTGRLICIAGRPAMGKSAVGLTLALNVAMADHAALYVSLEMSPPQMSNRILTAVDYSTCLHTGGTPVTTSQVRRQAFSPEQRERLRDLPIEALAANLSFNRGYSLTTEQLVRQIQLTKRRDPRLAVVVIDYLTLINYEEPGGEQNHTRAIGNLTKVLKRTALSLSIDIVILAQLSRAVEQRNDKRPQLSDLRESGRIEEDCDIVVGLYREAYYRPDADPYLLELLVLKQREGAVGSFPTTFIGAHGVVMDRQAPVIRAAPPHELEPAPPADLLGWPGAAELVAAQD
jgi:replicative DNA helicase